MADTTFGPRGWTPERLSSQSGKTFLVTGGNAGSLITTSGNFMTRVMFRLLSMSPMVQSAEKGAYPEVMCATEDGLECRALYGPTGMNEWVGPVGKGTLESFAYDKATMERLWALSEKETGFDWKL